MKEIISFSRQLADYLAFGGTLLCTQAYWMLVKTCARKKVLSISEKVLQEIFEKFLSHPSPETQELSSALLAHIIPLKEGYPSFLSAVQWIDLSLIKDKVLLERTTIAISKVLLEETGTPDFSYRFYNFLDYLEGVTETYPELVYTRYYFCKLLLHKKDYHECREWIRPLLRAKKNDFWVWHLAARCYDGQTQLSCLCKALNGGGKEQMLCSIRQDLAALLIDMGKWPEAKFEIERILETRQRENWKTPPQVAEWARSPHFKDTTSQRLKYDTLTGEAENLIWEEQDSVIALVTSITVETDTVQYVCQSGKRGKFSFKRSKIRRLSASTTVRLFFMEDERGISRLQHVQEYEKESTWIKEFSGALQLHSHGFGFIGEAFVPSELIRQCNYDKSTTYKCTAIYTFNSKKQQMGWKAVILYH